MDQTFDFADNKKFKRNTNKRHLSLDGFLVNKKQKTTMNFWDETYGYNNEEQNGKAEHYSTDGTMSDKSDHNLNEQREQLQILDINLLHLIFLESLLSIAKCNSAAITNSEQVWAELKLHLLMSPSDSKSIITVLQIYEKLLQDETTKKRILKDTEIMATITKLSIEENARSNAARHILEQIGSGDYISLKLEIERELSAIIGLEPIKLEIRTLLNKLMLDKKREQQGHSIEKRTMYHMCFSGNPGVGKTSIARLMGNLFKRLGILSKGHVVEVQRADLVGEYVGHTAPKTRKKIEEAQGGVLFIDEAYRLNISTSPNDFGKEAIEETMKEMLDAKDIIFIFAGYPKEMEEFLSSNPGLRRRVPLKFDFPDYSEAELAQILFKMVAKKNLKLAEKITEEQVANIIVQHTNEKQRKGANAGLVDNIIEAAKRRLDSRLDPMFDTGPKLVTITEDDLIHAVKSIK